MKNKKFVTPRPLKIAVGGDRRLTENLIVKVRAAAREFGLDVASVQIVPRPSVRPKTSKRGSRGRPKKPD